MRDEQRALPSGNVAFLFTDIEGSTRLLRELGDAYHDVKDVHDDLIRDTIQDQGGAIFGEEGDAFFAAFDTAAEAFDAAVACQQTVQRAAWPHGALVRVRMAIHAGYATPHRDDYSALAVNQTARILGAGHGGQILLSGEAADRLDPEQRDRLAALGRHRVRDFDQPPELLRVEADGWDDPLASPRVRPAENHNLVRSLTSLIGRADELTAIPDAIRAGSLVTLVGPGGVGKTRLALEVGFASMSSWPDGVWFIDLAGARTRDQILESITDATATPMESGRSLQADLTEHLAMRRTLLILDNCEQVRETAAQVVQATLESCPGVAFLATTRAPLNLRSEQVVRIPPLPVDGELAPALQLFVERAHGVLDGAQLEAARQICAELDGLPLAIELAAVRTASVSPLDALELLRQRAKFAVVNDPGLPERHRSLERVLDWSRDMIGAPAVRALGQLSAFASDFDLRAAVACVSGSDVDLGAAEVILELADHSLVHVLDAAGGSRFRLLHPIRDYAETLVDDAARHDASAALAAFYVRRLGPDMATNLSWLGEMDTEIDNIRGVIGQVVDQDPETALALACSIATHHIFTGALETGVREADGHCAMTDHAGPMAAALHAQLASLHIRMGQLDEASRALDQAEVLLGQNPMPGWADGVLLRYRGDIAVRQGDSVRAEELGRRALGESMTAIGRGRAWSLIGVALASRDDQLDAATRAFEEEVRAADEADSLALSLRAHGNLAESLARDGRVAEAARQQAIALDLGRAAGDRITIALSLQLTSRLAIRTGAIEDGVALHAAATGLLEKARFATYAEDDDLMEAALSVARESIDAAGFDAAVARGRALGDDTTADHAAMILGQIAARAEQVSEGAQP